MYSVKVNISIDKTGIIICYIYAYNVNFYYKKIK